MESRWDDAEAAATVARYAAAGVGEDLALRTYSARLLGRDPALVMHGGGNTSVKTTECDLYGDPVEVLCVKGSGWDLATIEPPGHPAVRRTPLDRLRTLPALSDEAMVAAQRQNLMDPGAPTPSVETLLHAWLPHRFVDHTHSIAVCAVVDQPDAEAAARDVWGGRVAVVPYIMPGFALARAAAAAFEADPQVEGLALLQHGVFSFGATARESYERMVSLVSAAEKHIARRGNLGPIAVPNRGVAAEAVAGAAARLPELRGALARAGAAAGAPQGWVLDLRTTDQTRRVVDDPRMAELATRGVATPDHVIRTKRGPVVLSPFPLDGGRAGDGGAGAGGDDQTREAPPAPNDHRPARTPIPGPSPIEGEGRASDDQALAAFVADYRAYFERQNARVGGTKRALDPLPRLAAIPGLGLVGIGRTTAEAEVAADIGEAWAATLLRAEAVGRYAPVGEDDLFDMEYWSLEQAKLGKAAYKPMAGRIVAVTGAGGAIGSATAAAFAAQGAEVALLDLDEAAAEWAARDIGPRALALGCDVTDQASTDAAFAAVAARLGGLDVLVSNAGSAIPGAMADLPAARLRESFELNFFAHQRAAQAAVGIMRRQGRGGVLLFSVSKQSVNPGPDFGAYGTAKAALLALVRQYALELGAEGIRANAVNADRIRSGLLTDAMIEERAAARGVSRADYLGGNLLKREVTAADVARAFVDLARAQATTGGIATVDGGNVAAMLR